MGGGGVASNIPVLSMTTSSTIGALRRSSLELLKL